VLREDGRLIPTTHFDLAGKPEGDAAEKSKAYVQRHWKFSETASDSNPNNAPIESQSLFDRIQNYSLCISGMAFQDVWTIDLERLHRCCIHVATIEGKLIPFCAYYLTNTEGRRLIEQSMSNC
jgi:hypothetical protein